MKKVKKDRFWETKYCVDKLNYNTQTRSNNICRMEEGWLFTDLFTFSFLCFRGKINITDVTDLKAEFIQLWKRM